MFLAISTWGATSEYNLSPDWCIVCEYFLRMDQFVSLDAHGILVITVTSCASVHYDNTPRDSKSLGHSECKFAHTYFCFLNGDLRRMIWKHPTAAETRFEDVDSILIFTSS